MHWPITADFLISLIVLTYTVLLLHRTCFDGTKTYGTFLSSHRRGRCSKISRGSVSAAMTMNSEIPRFNVLVAADAQIQNAIYTQIRSKAVEPSLAPFFNCL